MEALSLFWYQAEKCLRAWENACPAFKGKFHVVVEKYCQRMCSLLQPDSLVPLNKHIKSEPAAAGGYEKAFLGVKLAELVYQRGV